MARGVPQRPLISLQCGFVRRQGGLAVLLKPSRFFIPMYSASILRASSPAVSMPRKLKQWAQLIASDGIDQFREQQLLADFLGDVFCGLLGYRRPADDPQRYTISREHLRRSNYRVAVKSCAAALTAGRTMPVWR